MLGSDDADRTICHSHHQLFQQWISQSLEQQRSELQEYACRAGGPRALFQCYRGVIPPSARDVERQLYLTDLETLLEVLRVGGASANPTA